MCNIYVSWLSEWAISSLAQNSNIIVVTAFVARIGSQFAGTQSALAAFTGHLVEPNCAWATAVVSYHFGLLTWEPNTLAEYLGSLLVGFEVTNCTPFAKVLILQPTLNTGKLKRGTIICIVNWHTLGHTELTVWSICVFEAFAIFESEAFVTLGASFRVLAVKAEVRAVVAFSIRSRPVSDITAVALLLTPALKASCIQKLITSDASIMTQI